MKQTHENFGNLVLHAKASLFRMVRRFIIFLTPALALTFIGIVGLIDPAAMDMADEPWVAYIVLGGGILYFIFMIFFVKPYEVAIYEKGLLYKRRGRKWTEISFENSGLLDIIHTTRVSFVPVWRARHVTIGTQINAPDGTMEEAQSFATRFAHEATASNTFARSNTPKFHNFADTLIAVQLAHMTKDFTTENIFDASISFGENLVLTNGEFIYKKDKRREASVFLKDVQHASLSNRLGGGSWIRLESKPDETGQTRFLLDAFVDKINNLTILHYIVDLANGRVGNSTPVIQSEVDEF